MRKKKKAQSSCKSDSNIQIGVDYGLLLDQIKKNRGRQTVCKENVPLEDLIFFLRSTGQEIPADLIERFENKPVLKSFQHCWEFWADSRHGEHCAGCAIFANKIDHCFSAGKDKCSGCRYFREYIHPRIGFIHQINQPLAVCKNLSFWAGNEVFAKLCGLHKNELIGMGFEKVFHADSLETVIADFKKRELIGSGEEAAYNIFLNGNSGKREIRISVHPLNTPERTFLILVT